MDRFVMGSSFSRGVLALLLLSSATLAVHAQDLPLTETLHPSKLHPLDPASNVASPILESAVHKPLPEEYIWTALEKAADGKLLYTFPGIAEQTEPHYFRAHFRVTTVPAEATLYLAGPRSVVVY